MTTLAQIASAQYQKEVAANELFGAVSHAGLFGKRVAGTSGLVWGYYGGYMLVDGVLTSISDGTVNLTGATTNYIEATRAGVVSANTTGFTAGRIPLYSVVTTSTGISGTPTDFRTWAFPVGWVGSYLSKAFPSDANYTLTAAEARARVIRMTGTISATRRVIVPTSGEWIFRNDTTGGFSIEVIGADGSPSVGVTIANAKAAIVYGDGTNINRATADA